MILDIDSYPNVEKKDNVTVEEFKQTAEGMYVLDCSISWNLIDPLLFRH